MKKKTTPIKFGASTSSEQENNGDNSQVLNVDNSTAVLERISRVYAEQLMNDVSLIVGGVEYPAHRFMLCATSDVFQVMLMKWTGVECGKNRIVLQETTECANVFQSFLDYFYTGKIAITDSKIIPLLSLADKYNVKSLEDICIKYMKTHVAHAASQNQLISWLQYTAATGRHDDVTTMCHNFIKWNFDMVADSTDFDNLEPEMVIYILQQHDLIVHDELRLYEYVSRWIEFQTTRIIEETTEDSIERVIEKLVYSVMEYIRFPMMSPRQLADLLLNPLTMKYKDFFVDRFAIGMSFHSNQRDRINHTINHLPEGKLLFQPRLYTSDCWSTLLTIENFSSLPSYHTSTFVFSSHSTLAEHGDNQSADHLCEWVVDLFPKGVWFKKCSLIVWQGTVEVPECVLRTVRLAITCKDPPLPNYPDLRVKVGILITGCQSEIEHVMSVKEKVHYFSMNDRVCNIDDLIPFHLLNPTVGFSEGTEKPQGESTYLVGANKNELKLRIVISPLNDYLNITNNES